MTKFMVKYRDMLRLPANVDLGLLTLRLGFGFFMMYLHGYGKISGGPEKWAKTGASMQNLGIDFLPVFWGFMAAFSEFFCSILIMAGIFFRPASFLLAVTMIVAVVFHLSLPETSPYAGWSGATHALEFLIIYVAFLIAGPGNYVVKFR